MATQQYNLGKVSVTPKGAYSNSTNYDVLDEVYKDGGSYIALQATSGVIPGETAGWQSNWFLATKGIKSAVATTPNDGQTKITITFTDGTTYSFTYNNQVLAPGSTYTQLQVTLTAAGWNSSSKQQSVTVAGVTASNAVIICPATSPITNYNAYNNASCVPIAQGANSLTFVCDVIPTQNIVVNILLPV